MLAPAGKPTDVVTRMQTEAANALQAQDVKDRLATDSAETVGSSPAEFGALIKNELEKWSRVAKAAGIEPQ
jgi:tripartite-type tricarboxylate transporter receptor subunit TctC